VTKALLAILTVVLVPVSAFAIDGVVLINQASVIVSGGYPYTITQPAATGCRGT
jgi:hypothetical protein